MVTALSVPVANTLLDKLPRRYHTRFQSACEPVELEFGTLLCDVEKPYQHAYFPTGGLISLVSGLPEHNPLEMALIGQEGMLGASLLLGINRAPIRAIVHAPGLALRITAGKLQQQMRDSGALRKILSHYLYLRMVELSLIGGCVRYHRIPQRLARALLLAHDAAQGESFNLTHDYMADMLGVRRSSITIAAGDLQAHDVISYSRGKINVLDRSGLEVASCECYQALRARHSC